MDVKRQVLHAGLDSCEGEMTYQGITFMVDKCPHHMCYPAKISPRFHIAWRDGYRVASMCYNRHTHAHLWRLCAAIAT